MSSKDTAISVRDLSKCYTIAAAEKRSTLAETLMQRARHPFRRTPKETFWALKDVSFDVKKGEVVGIIGRNGAGKSTLLKVLSRITEPSTGVIDLYGRVGSLLEVGTGFHPELSGRENIFLNGAILGMPVADIRNQFDAIVDFAGVEKFLDTPVKRYSSGMYVRLAFAVAAHLEPEILIVDEVLAVGDAEFQKKCLGKMQDVSRAGRTILFVSHNTAAIIGLCQKCILLEQGQIKLQGMTEEVISHYLRNASQTDGIRLWNDKDQCSNDPGLQIHEMRVVSGDQEVTGQVDIRHPFSVEIEYTILKSLPSFRVALQFVTSEGTIAFHTSDSSDPSCPMTKRSPGRHTTKCLVPGNLLNEGRYSLTLGVDIPHQKVLALEEAALGFIVEQTGGASARFREKWPGVVCPQLEWNTTNGQKCDDSLSLNSSRNLQAILTDQIDRPISHE